MPQDIALFQAIGAKMDYLNQRQRIIAQNMSNADTPGYKPKDIVNADFSSILKGLTGEPSQVRIETTNPQHMPNPSETQDGVERKQKRTYEIAPTGNAVIMEQQLLNAGQNTMDYNMMTNLIQKNVGMIKTALGRNG